MITEPMTMATDYLLAVVSVGVAWSSGSAPRIRVLIGMSVMPGIGTIFL